MPKKRNRVRDILRELERIEKLKKGRKKRLRELLERFDFMQLNLRLRVARIHRNTIEFRGIDRYRIWYENYRHIKFKVTDARWYWVVSRVKVPDYTSRVENLVNLIKLIPLRFTKFLRDLMFEVMKRLMDYSPVGIARQIHLAYTLFRMSREIKKGVIYAPVITVWKDRFVEIYLDRRIEEWLRDPQRFPAVVELLGTIARQLLVSKYVLVIPPEQLELWKGIINILFEYYVSYTRRMPCRRTQLMLRLTPVTLHVMRGLGVRMYVVRWMRRENMSSPFLYADKPIDVHFRHLMRYKYYGEVISTMIVGGDTDNLKETDVVPTWRDIRQLPRDMMKIIDTFYQWWKITDALARSIGRPEMSDALGDCSVYIRFRPSKNWLKRTLKRIDREYWLTYRYD